VVKCGTMSLPLKRMKAPLLPICTQIDRRKGRGGL
jgi:hypothetical protein